MSVYTADYGPDILAPRTETEAYVDLGYSNTQIADRLRNHRTRRSAGDLERLAHTRHGI